MRKRLIHNDVMLRFPADHKNKRNKRYNVFHFNAKGLMSFIISDANLHKIIESYKSRIKGKVRANRERDGTSSDSGGRPHE